MRRLLRAFRASPAFAITAILTLAIGIGANAAIFTLADRVLLRGLPYPNADELVLVSLQASGMLPGRIDTLPWSYPKYETMRGSAHPFAAVAGFDAEDLTLETADGPRRIAVEYVTPAYFTVLGVPALEGRPFLPDEPEDQPAQAVVISRTLHERSLGGRPGIVGQAIRLNGQPLTVVGVVDDFRGLSGDAEAWVPVSMLPLLAYPEILAERGSHWLRVVARIRPGLAPASLDTELARIGATVAAAHPARERQAEWTALATPLREARSDPALQRSLVLLWGAVTLVLLIACVNVANLLLARGAARHRDLAVRAVLGAGRGALVRQMLAESLALAGAGAALGLLLATWAVDAVAALGPGAAVAWGISTTAARDLATAGLDGRVVLYTLGVSLVVAAVIGLLPALRLTRGDLASGLGARTAVGAQGRRQHALSAALVAGELALALVLLIGAGLLLDSLARLQAVDPGFRADGVLTFRIDPDPARYDRAAAPQLHATILQRLTTLPGVRHASVDRCAPLSGACNASVVTGVDGRAIEADQAIEIGVHYVAPDHFRLLGIPLLAGRAFEAATERPGAPRAVIVNAAAARMFWPDRPAVGGRLQVGTGYWRREPIEVIGVVGDVRYDRLTSDPGPAVYVPALQYGAPRTMVYVRTDGDPLRLTSAVQRAVLEVDPQLPIFDVRTLRDRAGDALARPRFGAVLLGAFAAIALVLAALGVYGVMTYAVTQRVPELGVRLALGATGGEVLRLVMRRAAAMTAAGIAAGAVLALALGRASASLLVDVARPDPALLAALGIGLGLIALLAAFIPAWRASRVSPMVAMRSEA